MWPWLSQLPCVGGAGGGRRQFSEGGTHCSWQGLAEPSALESLKRCRSVRNGVLVSFSADIVFNDGQGERVANELANLFRSCPQMESIRIEGFKSTSGVTAEASAICIFLKSIEEKCKSLKSLTLGFREGCNTNDCLIQVLGRLMPRLVQLNVARWDLGRQAGALMTWIRPQLQKAHQLQSLDLTGCWIQDLCFTGLVDALSHNATALETLRLSGNRLSNMSLPESGRLLEGLPSLKLLYLSGQQLVMSEDEYQTKHHLLDRFLAALKAHPALETLCIPGHLVGSMHLSRYEMVCPDGFPQSQQARDRIRWAIHQNQSIITLAPMWLCASSVPQILEVHATLIRNRTKKEIEALDAAPLGAWPYLLARYQNDGRTAADRTFRLLQVRAHCLRRGGDDVSQSQTLGMDHEWM